MSLVLWAKEHFQVKAVGSNVNIFFFCRRRYEGQSKDLLVASCLLCLERSLEKLKIFTELVLITSVSVDKHCCVLCLNVTLKGTC